ncbi:MAG: FAD-binding protein [Eggerthellaceae bacterium]|jgi:uncharacterized FAD-dependent dehydrogenase|nr:FAD-binding protein [Eggerthellaceae bacterium]
MQQPDCIIVGAGPAGIFTALSLLESGDGRHVVMIEKGLPLEKRSCPKAQTEQCAGCSPCRITTGFAGAGAFSDGKLSLSCDVGGDLPQLIGRERAQRAIGVVDDMYVRFGADQRIEGTGDEDAVADIRRRAIKAGLKLIDCPIRHLGTECAQQLYMKIQQYLIDAGVEIRFECECRQLLIEDGVCKGVMLSTNGQTQELRAPKTIIATGRRGADWLDRECRALSIAHTPGPVDVGVRVEVRNEVMETVNNVLYESKLVGYPQPFKNKVRTFCQNPGGFVSQENYDGGLAVVNGHSFKQRKSPNTNLAILCSQNFREPFDQPIAYAQKVGELTNMLGAGHILVQRFGDIIDGKRTWAKELERANVQPTLTDAVAGDITAALPYRVMTNILNFMLAVDEVVPGIAAEETLLYSPELKFYSNRIKMDEHFTTSVQGLHCLGDSSGWTRGLMMSSVMGYLMGKELVGASN